jgi:hypothetical protein
MAMKRKKTTRARKAARAKPAARRRASRSSGTSDETMNIIAGILVVILIGLGIYFYQAQQKSGAIEPPVKVAMVAGE